MIFKIRDGSEINIEIGMKIKCAVGYLPREFDDKFMEVLDIEGYPMAQVEPSQLSCISPELIIEIQE